MYIYNMYANAYSVMYMYIYVSISQLPSTGAPGIIGRRTSCICAQFCWSCLDTHAERFFTVIYMSTHP